MGIEPALAQIPSRTEPNRVAYEACWCAYLMAVDVCAVPYPKSGGLESLLCCPNRAESSVTTDAIRMPRRDSEFVAIPLAKFPLHSPCSSTHINVWFKMIASVNNWTPTMPRRT